MQARAILEAVAELRRDGVDASWEYVQPLLDHWSSDRAAPLPAYPPGSQGPDDATGLPGRDGDTWLPLG